MNQFFMCAVLLVGVVSAVGCQPGTEQSSTGKPSSGSELMTKGVDELVAHLVAKGSPELKDDSAEKLKEIVAKYRPADAEEYLDFSVAVKDKLIEKGLLQPGDPTRFQYGLHHLAAIYHDQE